LLLRESKVARSSARETPCEIFTGWVVEVADPWGNVLGLTDYVKKPELART
jgi:hypothetical protein